MELKDIKEMSFDYKKEIMTIMLYEKVKHKGYLKDSFSFKCDEKTFIEKCDKWLKFKNNYKNI